MFSVASFFAGVGGIDLGFEETGEFKTVYANEFDSYASETFEMNYPTVKVDQRDVLGHREFADAVHGKNPLSF